MPFQIMHELTIFNIRESHIMANCISSDNKGGKEKKQKNTLLKQGKRKILGLFYGF